MFESSATLCPKVHCLGSRPYDPKTKSFGSFQWIDYQTVQKRRANLGVGLVELHKKHGRVDQKYGVGLWCQNRPEWQIAGRSPWSNPKSKIQRLQFFIPFLVSAFISRGTGESPWILHISFLFFFFSLEFFF